jgi:hypothetical protein
VGKVRGRRKYSASTSALGFTTRGEGRRRRRGKGVSGENEMRRRTLFDTLPHSVLLRFAEARHTFRIAPAKEIRFF